MTLVRLVVGAIAVFGIARESGAQYYMTAIGVSTEVSFDGFEGAGWSPEPDATQLDSDAWRVSGLSDGECTFGGSCETGDFARGLDEFGGVSTGGIYAFDVDTGGEAPGRALGVQPTATDFTPGTITVAFVNATGDLIMDFDLQLDLWVNNDQSRSSSLAVSYSTNDLDYSDLSELDYSTPEDAAPGGFFEVPLPIASVSLPTPLLEGDTLFVRLASDDVSGTGSRDELAIVGLAVVPFGDTPVKLTSFGGFADAGDAVLVWASADESELLGFDVQRSGPGGFETLSHVAARGRGSTYSYRVFGAAEGRTAFRLGALSRDGIRTYTAEVVVGAATDLGLLVGDVYPNPASSVVRVPVSGGPGQRVRIVVFDVLGRRVVGPQEHNMESSAADDFEVNVRALPAGVYVIAVQGQGNGVATRSFVRR